MSDTVKIFGIGFAGALAVVALIYLFVFLAGLTFGQRCAVEAHPNEPAQACVQRLRTAINDKEQ
ncbi:hypothetical protein [Achromobacter insolitus]|uniref:Uncharacterized protein n=1 Tax=Achromobacter insolitus TaxID=217204 RepID=A0A6S7F4X0_9BURK|nr:hypothetical protein [Achromobacter insolitus]CAB3931550.1 hypothetical protein LMG6000_02210 [Achromobacter insolitus]CAB3939421.1 hypothetical protein LMG5997_04027 [Achromobacter insolitus]